MVVGRGIGDGTGLTGLVEVNIWVLRWEDVIGCANYGADLGGSHALYNYRRACRCLQMLWEDVRFDLSRSSVRFTE